MPTVLERLPQGARVAVVRLRSLGDCVLSTPAIHILKQARPDLRVAVAVENVFRAVFEGNPDIDELLPPAGARRCGSGGRGCAGTCTEARRARASRR